MTEEHFALVLHRIELETTTEGCKEAERVYCVKFQLEITVILDCPSKFDI